MQEERGEREARSKSGREQFIRAENKQTNESIQRRGKNQVNKRNSRETRHK